jgi:protein SCO1/2
VLKRLSPRRALVLGGAAGLLVLAVAAYLTFGRGTAAPQTVYGDAPAFALIDQLERPVTSDGLRGRVVLADFIYTSCRDICPELSLKMQALQERLRREGLLDGRVQLLSFTVDAARDTPPVLRAYAERHHADPESWRFLTGDEGVVTPLIVRGFLLGVEALRPDGHGDEDYEVIHSSRFVLIDRRWRVRAYYEARDLDIERAVRDIRGLLR